jgi:hypothetical protein
LCFSRRNFDQLFNSSEKRLASILLLLAHFWQKRKTGERSSQDQSGDAGGDDRHKPLADQLLYEPVQKTGLYSHNGGLQVHTSLLNVVLHD